MAIDVMNADYIVDMSAILTGVESYSAMIDEMETLLKDMDRTCSRFPQKAWSGEGRDEFDIESVIRVNELIKVMDRMTAIKQSLVYLLRESNDLRKEAVAVKDEICQA